MDPICHTLVGTTLAQAGLGRRTSLASAALVLGANAPDVDGLTYLLGESLWWRRGWTHGVLALVVWPFLLTALLLAWDRGVRGRRPRRRPLPDPLALLSLSALAVLTHPTLDYMNNYGLRWLMPFVDRWYYGDALFIVDPWMWAALGLGTLAGWWLARRAGGRAVGERTARAALALAAVYVLVMFGLGQIGRSVVRAQFGARNVALAQDPMVSPVFADPTVRYVVADDGRRYHVAGFRWWPSASLDRGTRVIAHDRSHPAIDRARHLPETRGFLHWARFPFYVVEDAGDSYVVTMEDARYAPPGTARSWASLQVRVPKSAALAPRLLQRPRELPPRLLALGTWCRP
jgi:inner membrane protein